MSAANPNPLDYASAPIRREPSPTWTGVLTFGAIVMSALALMMGLGGRRAGLYAFEIRNATVLLVLSLASIVAAALRLRAHPRPPRRRIAAAVCVAGLSLALGMIVLAAWGLATGLRL